MRTVLRNLDKITFSSLSAHAYNELLNEIYYGKRAGFFSYEIDFSSIGENGVYPNTVTPLAGYLELLKEEGVDVKCVLPPNTYLEKTSFNAPVLIADNLVKATNSPFDTVWKFNDAREIYALTDAMVKEISQKAVTGKGSLEALSWMLSEIMDNVLQHAGSGTGYVMGQTHLSKKWVSVCVFDTGQGIFNSLRASIHAPRHPLDAITMSIKEGVTRDKNIGQGNGLWGLHSLIAESAGQLSIVSQSARYDYLNGNIQTKQNITFPSNEHPCTMIDFQTSFDSEIAISKTFGSGKSDDVRILRAESDKRGEYIFRVADSASGTGTRQAGERSRNELVNLLNSTSGHVLIDFENVAVVSSSFADEFLGKLIISFGISKFFTHFTFTNINEIVSTVVNRSVSQRISSSVK